ncbi:MAG: D-alanyl-D-alanine carboxypeptidase/D-alanyl-D-alanine-endopeptidase, partial [Thermoanaerobaculia bacterium]|nr:D-alanyl-D-alanine carboxypeptidase/D-alanyl-D-alanine-endopeptidase [Thermoanaerobaculia bacterium]
MVGGARVAAGLLALLATQGAGAEGFRGVLAVAGDRVVAEENADRLFTPASVQKLLVAAAALDALDPEHRIVTRLVADGELAGGSLRGDHVLVAAGDPTRSDRFHEDDPQLPLRTLARDVAETGLRRVEGRLRIDVSGFPGRRYHPDLPLAELGLGLGAPTAAVALDDNVFEIVIEPGARLGDPGRAATAEAVTIENRTVTVGKDRHARGSVTFLPVWGENRVVVEGEYPISEGAYRVPVAVPAPALRVGEALHAQLAAAGVEVAGVVAVDGASPAPEGPILASWSSPPLAEVLAPVLRDSSNWHAAMVLQLLAHQVGGEGRLDDGMELVASFLVERVGVPETAFDLRDAAGLSPYNLVSPRAVVQVLRHALATKWGLAL